jgi:hypothetical protein
LKSNSKGKDWKIQTVEIVVLMVHSRFFGILLKSILVMIPKDDFSLMTCSFIIKIQKIIAVRKQLPDFLDLEDFQKLLNA